MEIELHRAVSGHRCGLVKRDKPNVDRHILIFIYAVSDRFGLGFKVFPCGAPIRVELHVGKVDYLVPFSVLRQDPFKEFYGIKSSLVVSWMS
jgi:hypothetical protein